LNITGNIVDTGPLSLITGASGNVSLAPNGTNILVATTTGANITGTLNATANIISGNVTTAGTANIGTLAVTGAGTVGTTLIVTGNITGGNVTTTGTANVGTLAVTSTSSHTGNATFGNISGTGSATFTGNVSGGNLLTSSIVGTAITITSTGALNLAPTGNVTVNSRNINNLADPAAAQDAATKSYVDSVAQGLDTKASVVAATTANITLSGTQTIDGLAVIAGERVLVKNQTLSQNNGIYLCAAGAWSRTTDMDTWAEVPGAYVFVEGGTTQADTGWVCTSDAGGTLGTTAIVWTQFSGAGSYTAGTGLTLTGTAFSVNASQTQITSVGTLGSLSVTGNITGGNILGGANVNATIFTGTTVSVTANVTGGNLTTSGKISATGNISTAGMFSSQDIETSANVTAVGNVTGGNLRTAGQVTATGNITGGNILTVGLISSTGNITTAANVNGANLTLSSAISAAGNITAANISGGNLLTGGIVSAFGNVIGGNINTLGLVSASGNVTGNYFLGNGSQLTGIISSVSSMSNGNSNVAIASTGGNVQVAVNGVSNVVVIGQGTLSVLGPMATAKTISANSVVADSVNAVLISPVTIGNGISVTVPTSSTLYIFTPA
jgi:hypothetical protein